MDDGVLLTFIISMIASALIVVVMSLSKRPRVRRPIDSPPDTPVTIGF